MYLITETKHLKPIATAVAPAWFRPFNKAGFFQTRPGLYVWDSFYKLFNLDENDDEWHWLSERPYVASLLKESAWDRDIRPELPENHLSTLEDIAGFIENQPEGKEGFLLTNNYVNIFYVEGKDGEVVVVNIIWRRSNQSWDIYAGSLDTKSSWQPKSQVICPGDAVL